MIAGYFSALLPIVLAASIQTATPPASSNQPERQTCPVTIQSDLHFTNASQQPITAIVFHTVRVNLVGEEQGPTVDQAKLMAALNTSPDSRSEQTYSAKKDGLQPGQAAKMSNNMAIYGRREKSVIRIYARAVKFADGTTWKDNGSHSCKWER
jgi:hypothetical protein